MPSSGDQLPNVDVDEPNAITREFKDNPTIENYVRLRRENPDVEIEPKIYGGLDHAYRLEDDLKRFGIDIRLYVYTLDADEAAISELSLKLLENMILAQSLERKGETHLSSRGKIIPDHLIDWLTCSMLDALSWTGSLYIPRDLIVLARSRLIPGQSDIEKTVDTRERKNQSAMIAGQMLVRKMKPSFRSVAKILGVQPSTVTRWFVSEQEFTDLARDWEQYYAPGGLHDELKEIKENVLRKKQRAQRQPSDLSS
jgi:hypothetical protein